MERADHVLMFPGDFGWSDVGGWDAFDALRDRDENGNITVGKTLLLDSQGCTAYSVDRLVAAVGVKDLIIVQAGESVLVCPASQAQRVKEIVEPHGNINPGNDFRKEKTQKTQEEAGYDYHRGDGDTD